MTTLLFFLAAPGARAADDKGSPSALRKPEPPVVVLSPPPPEPAPATEPAPAREAEERAAGHRFELTLGAAIFPGALGDLRFTGGGTLAGTGRRIAFQRSGRELGLRNPTFWGPEFALGYRHTYFGFAISGAYGGNLGADAVPTDVQAAAQVGTSSVKAYGGGIELYGALPLGPVTLSAGAAAGVRGFSMPLSGFEPTTCTSSSRRGRRTYPCAETVSTQVALYLQPRFKIDVALDAKQVLFLGAYVGMDALGDRSILGGAMFGVRFP